MIATSRVLLAEGLAARAVLETSPATHVVKLDTSPEIVPRRPTLTSAMPVARRAITPKIVKKGPVTFATTAIRKAISPGTALKQRWNPATIVERRAICNAIVLTLTSPKVDLVVVVVALATDVASEATLHVIALLLMTSATVVARLAILPKIAVSRHPMKVRSATPVVRLAIMHVIVPRKKTVATHAMRPATLPGIAPIMQKTTKLLTSKQSSRQMAPYKNEVSQESML